MLEYLKGGQLLDHLHTIGEHYTERQAAALFAQARTLLGFRVKVRVRVRVRVRYHVARCPWAGGSRARVASPGSVCR